MSFLQKSSVERRQSRPLTLKSTIYHPVPGFTRKLGQQLPQDIGQNAAVLVVFDLYRRIDSQN
jgi:hypothetical protein